MTDCRTIVDNQDLDGHDSNPGARFFYPFPNKTIQFCTLLSLGVRLTEDHVPLALQIAVAVQR